MKVDQKHMTSLEVDMRRDVRSMTLTWKGESILFVRPGWYSDEEVDQLIIATREVRRKPFDHRFFAKGPNC